MRPDGGCVCRGWEGGDGWQLCGVDGIKEVRLADLEGLVGGPKVKAQAGHTLPHTGGLAGTGVLG